MERIESDLQSSRLPVRDGFGPGTLLSVIAIAGWATVFYLSFFHFPSMSEIEWTGDYQLDGPRKVGYFLGKAVISVGGTIVFGTLSLAGALLRHFRLKRVDANTPWKSRVALAISIASVVLGGCFVFAVAMGF